MNRTAQQTEPPVGVSATDKLIVQSLAKLDQTALGISVGVLAAAAIFLATNILIFKGGDQIGPNLALISQYFIGYEVTFRGSLIGAFYGFVTGFVLGWLAAFLRNAVISFYLFVIKFESRVTAVNDFIDNP